VANDDDPYGTIGYTRNQARAWNAGFVAVGALEHINSASGLGDWPIGAMLLEAFRAGLVRR
jgi:predicted alpha/beta hydrolase family esterase